MSATKRHLLRVHEKGQKRVNCKFHNVEAIGLEQSKLNSICFEANIHNKGYVLKNTHLRFIERNNKNKTFVFYLVYVLCVVVNAIYLGYDLHINTTCTLCCGLSCSSSVSSAR